MGRPATFDSKTFWRAANQRLATARFLVDHTSFYLDAMYLAGYAVESTLKALILARTPASGRGTILEELVEVGSKGHDFEYLKGELESVTYLKRPRPRPVAMPKAIKEDLRRVGEWSTGWRFETGLRREEEARSFIAAVSSICAWVERSL